LQELPKPIALGTPQGGDPHPTVCATEDRGDGDYDHVEQPMAALRLAVRILKVGEAASKRAVAGEWRQSSDSSPAL
jgi:hypothetical protein